MTELACVIQCGGRGERLNSPCPKPLIELPDGSRPLSNVLQDIPAEVPVYLHVLREHLPVFQRFLGTHGNFGHRVSYLIQSEHALFDDDGEPLAYPDGTAVTASDGSATFVRHFARLPELFCIIDGAKPGVYYPDILRAGEMLESDAVVFARPVPERSISEELAALRNPSLTHHPRYARINEAAQQVFEHPCLSEDVVRDRGWLATAGTVVVRAKRMADELLRIEGTIVESRSMDSVFVGKARHLKMNQVLYGYNGRASGLRFQTLVPEVYIPGIKHRGDVERYAELKAQGLFGYREVI